VANVRNLFRAAKKRLPMEEVPEVRAIANHGLEGCAHARPGQREILIVDGETLDAMDLAPGIIRENITTTGLNVNSLEVGRRLRVGSVCLEVTGICTPCDQLERVRPGLRRELWGRRGMLCRVVEGGTIRRGDVIEKMALSKELAGAKEPVTGSS
jgi:MOSC domain-containing protein YiiM